MTTGTDQQQDAPRAAANLLEMAARDADAWRAEARTEADEVLAGAKAEAETILRESRAEAEKVRAELETETKEHQAEVQRLQQLEAESRDRLRGQLRDMLEKLDSP